MTDINTLSTSTKSYQTLSDSLNQEKKIVIRFTEKTNCIILVWIILFEFLCRECENTLIKVFFPLLIVTEIQFSVFFS